MKKMKSPRWWGKARFAHFKFILYYAKVRHGKDGLKEKLKKKTMYQHFGKNTKPNTYLVFIGSWQTSFDDYLVHSHNRLTGLPAAKGVHMR